MEDKSLPTSKWSTGELEIKTDPQPVPLPDVQRYYFDASMLKDASCLRRVYWTAIQGYVPQGYSGSIGNLSLLYGNACHKFAENMVRGLEIQKNLEYIRNYYSVAEKLLEFSKDNEFRTPSHLLKTCKKYYQTFSDEHLDWDYVHTEQQFSFPFWKSLDGKIELLICGTLDIVKQQAGVWSFMDHKTSSSYFVDTYFDQYEMDIQMQLYSWALRKILKLPYYPECSIRGWFIKKPTKKSEDEGGPFDGVTFKTFPTIYFSKERMSQFESWLKGKLTTLIHFFLRDVHEMKDFLEYSACKNYGLCKYFKVCSKKPSDQAGILHTLFQQKPYEPLHFRD